MPSGIQHHLHPQASPFSQKIHPWHLIPSISAISTRYIHDHEFNLRWRASAVTLPTSAHFCPLTEMNHSHHLAKSERSSCAITFNEKYDSLYSIIHDYVSRFCGQTSREGAQKKFNSIPGVCWGSPKRI